MWFRLSLISVFRLFALLLFRFALLLMLCRRCRMMLVSSSSIFITMGRGSAGSRCSWV